MAVTAENAVTAVDLNFEEKFRSSLADRGIYLDNAQETALSILSTLIAEGKKEGWIKSLFSKNEKRGVYLWGEPGRGKTVLMDGYYELIDTSKRRIHFHEFLRDMHQRMALLSGKKERFITATKEFCEGIELLCFDEFHVHDIADSVFIGKVLEALLSHGIRIVATSNYQPDGLMPDPVSHERFKPTIELINKHFDIVHLDGKQDYRTQHEIDHSCFFDPLDARTKRAFERLFKAMEPQTTIEVCHIEVANRWIECHAVGRKAVWTDFDMLCKAQRSYVDYLDLAEQFEVLLLSGMTDRSLENPNTVKRFLWLIDVIYDKGKGLVLASERNYEVMLNNASGVDDLNRTLSRLHEMSRTFKSPLP